MITSFQQIDLTQSITNLMEEKQKKGGRYLEVKVGEEEKNEAEAQSCFDRI